MLENKTKNKIKSVVIPSSVSMHECLSRFDVYQEAFERLGASE